MIGYKPELRSFITDHLQRIVIQTWMILYGGSAPLTEFVEMDLADMEVAAGCIKVDFTNYIDIRLLRVDRFHKLFWDIPTISYLSFSIQNPSHSHRFDPHLQPNLLSTPNANYRLWLLAN